MQILGVANSYASAPVNAPTSLSVSSVTSTTADIAFTAPSNDGGAAITNYEFNLNGGAFTALSPADATTPVTITGLSAGTAYTVTLRAVNIVGAGPASTGLSVTSADTFNTATGGTITDYSEGGLNYRSHTFTSGGTFTLSSIGSNRAVQILVVGGGGGGGGTQLGRGYGDGGGGAGGFATTTMLLSATGYQVTVGGGGGGYGGSGGQSSFGASTSLVTANGGAGGSGCEFCAGTGGAGGSASIGALGTSNVTQTGFTGRNGAGGNGQTGPTNTFKTGSALYYSSSSGASWICQGTYTGGIGAWNGSDGSCNVPCASRNGTAANGSGGPGGTANCGTGIAGEAGIVIVRYRRA